MRFIKLAIISFLFFFVLLTIISLFIPSRVRISKATNIGGTPGQVLNYVGDTATWNEWHPLIQQLKLHGRQQHLLAKPLAKTDSTVIFQTQYNTQSPITNGWQVYHFPSADSLTLQWYMDFDLEWYPWQKFGSLFYENTYGAIMQQGLDNLRQKPLP
ncbi:MAG TPA: SRPBCC family protein [Flavisolibacter sp.]|nr:SRPBCC family protein [Flavisolibacter sp.]